MACLNDDGSKKNPTKWSPDDIQLFFEILYKYELMWNVRHVGYSNKMKKETSLLKLNKDLISQDLVVPDVAYIRARIKSIKTTYRLELLKVIPRSIFIDLTRRLLPTHWRARARR
jgi:hypothetical protein